jgi:hypothetical protein
MAILERTFLSNLAENLLPGGGLRIFTQLEDRPAYFEETTPGADPLGLFTEPEIDEISKRCMVFMVVYE